MKRKEAILTGKQFGELTVTAFAGKHGSNKRWRCRCSCGRELTVWQSNLLAGRTRSCGCKVPAPADRHYVEGTSLKMISSKTISRSNTSGVRGVYWNASCGKWVAQITFQGKTHYLGQYSALEQAAAARAAAEEEYFGSFLRAHSAGR